ncbi:MAG: ADP-ribosylglycohydrolase family protein [Anaerolineae bacterium]
MKDERLYRHILGGLLGEALGDAWGMPALLTPEETWQRFGGWIDRFYPGPPDHPVHAGLPAGRVTDDTEQAFALAQAIIADGGVKLEGVAQAIVSWYESVDGDRSPYIGPSTRRAVQAIRRGDPLTQTGLRGDTNGGAMRVCPVGLIHPGDVHAAARDAAFSCIPTHNTQVAASGAAAVAGAIAQALLPASTLQELIEAGMQAACEALQWAAPWMGASVPRRIELAVTLARADKPDRERLQDLYDLIGTTLATSESVPAAFGVLVMGEGDLLRTATYAANLSGDADTIGAMACAIVGAWRGVDSFPPEVIATLKHVNPELDFEGVALGLYRLAEGAALPKP